MANALSKLLSHLREEGVWRTLVKVGRKLRERVAPPRLRQFALVRNLLAGKEGLEVGGPSPLFGARGLIPIYSRVAALDGCNFSTETMWEGRIAEGMSFRYDPARAPGRQYVVEASDLSAVADGRYDFVLSCHSLEHVANPLKALGEWLRVLRADGALLLVVPHRDGTFDRRREVTPFEHLLADFAADVGEDDLTHAEEFIERLDYELAGIDDREDFVRRTRDNLHNRGIHHHVFDTALVVRLCDHLRLQVLLVEPASPCHIVVLARKPEGGQADNSAFLDARAAYRRTSPFSSDRL